MSGTELRCTSCNGLYFQDDDLRRGVPAQRCLNCAREVFPKPARSVRNKALDTPVNIDDPNLTLFDVLLWFWQSSDAVFDGSSRGLYGPKASLTMLGKAHTCVTRRLAEREAKRG